MGAGAERLCIFCATSLIASSRGSDEPAGAGAPVGAPKPAGCAAGLAAFGPPP